MGGIPLMRSAAGGSGGEGWPEASACSSYGCGPSVSGSVEAPTLSNIHVYPVAGPNAQGQYYWVINGYFDGYAPYVECFDL